MPNSTVTAPNAVVIQAILEKNYGADEEGFYPMNQKLSVQLVKTIEDNVDTLPAERLKRKVTNIIWDHYAGGGLAEAVAEEILGY